MGNTHLPDTDSMQNVQLLLHLTEEETEILSERPWVTARAQLQRLPTSRKRLRSPGISVYARVGARVRGTSLSVSHILTGRSYNG